MSLQAVLYDNNLSEPTLQSRLAGKTKDIRLLWEIHGGLRTIALTWAGPPIEAYEFYKTYMGYRLIIIDQYCDRPVADGFITGLAISPIGVHILANGFWFRHFDQLYAFDDTAQDSQQGNLDYLSGAEFQDDAQDFNDWKTTSGDLQYKIEVGNLGSYQESEGTIDNDNDFATSGGGTAREWYAQRFIALTGANTGKVTFQLKKTGTPTGSLTVSIYDEAAGKPNAIIGTASVAVDITTLTTSYDWIDFTWSASGPSLSADTPYFAVLKTTAYTEDADTISVGTDGDGGDGDVVFQYNGGTGAWTVVSTDAITNYRIAPDSVNTISWGFLGNMGGGGATDIKVYRDYAGTVPGWLGESPTGQTPIRYAVLTAYAYKTTTDIIKEALTNEVPAVGTDQSNIDETNTIVGFWQPPIEEGGLYPGEIIEKLASLSDSTNKQWNYWLRNSMFDGVTPQLPTPYFKAQVDNGTFDWQIQPSMLAPASLTMERNIQEMRNHVRVIYRNMDEDDALTISDTASDATSIADYWQREVILTGGDLFNEGANQYRDLYLAKYKDALLGKSLLLTSPYVLNDSGAKYPLWYPIKMGKSYFRVNLFPDPALFTTSFDRKQIGQATVMEYSDAQHSLRIHLDMEPNDVDFLLARIAAFR